jgi:hypothetical protein
MKCRVLLAASRSLMARPQPTSTPEPQPTSPPEGEVSDAGVVRSEPTGIAVGDAVVVLPQS